MPLAASVRTGPGRDRVHAHAARAELVGEVAHAGLERGLGDGHHVVPREHPLARHVGERDHRAALVHQRLGGAGHRDHRVRRDVERGRERLARGLDEAVLRTHRAGRRRSSARDVEPVHTVADLGPSPGRCWRRRTRRNRPAGRCRCFPRASHRPSSRSPWYVNASLAPCSCSFCAIAHAIERLLATPATSAVFP